MPDVGTVRYTVMAAAPTTDRTVLVDLGGPGLSLFGAHWPIGLRDSLPKPWQSANLLLLEEPWVTHRYDGACRSTVSTYYEAVQRGESPAHAPIAEACQLGQGRWGWTASSYQSAVTAVAKAEKLKVEDFVGASFAGRRLFYLRDTPLRAVDIVDPAPAAGVGGDRYLEDRRTNALIYLQTNGCRCREVATVVQTLNRARDYLQRSPVQVAGRSVPVSGADVGAAALALAYQSKDGVRRGWEALRDPARGAALIGALSDNTWNRFGVADLSPSWLAYLDEACVAFPGWKQTPDRTDAVREFLQAFHAPCADVPQAQRAVASGVVRATVAKPAICVVVANDGVTGSSFTESWRRMSNVQIHRTHDDVHGSLSALSICDAAG